MRPKKKLRMNEWISFIAIKPVTLWALDTLSSVFPYDGWTFKCLLQMVIVKFLICRFYFWRAIKSHFQICAVILTLLRLSRFLVANAWRNTTGYHDILSNASSPNQVCLMQVRQPFKFALSSPLYCLPNLTRPNQPPDLTLQAHLTLQG